MSNETVPAQALPAQTTTTTIQVPPAKANTSVNVDLTVIGAVLAAIVGLFAVWRYLVAAATKDVAAKQDNLQKAFDTHSTIHDRLDEDLDGLEKKVDHHRRNQDAVNTIISDKLNAQHASMSALETSHRNLESTMRDMKVDLRRDVQIVGDSVRDLRDDLKGAIKPKGDS